MAECEPRKSTLLGATLGEKHLASLRQAIDEGTLPEGEIVVLDFKDVDGVNASYIKSTVLWLFLCGQLYSKRNLLGFPLRHLSDPRPYDVYFAVAGGSREVEDEFIEFFMARQIPLLIVTEIKKGRAVAANLEGHLEAPLKTTLSALLQNGGGSAPELHENFSKEAITVTAWNNRLSDLNAARIVSRSRKGKVWQYQPIIERITYGRKLY